MPHKNNCKLIEMDFALCIFLPFHVSAIQTFHNMVIEKRKFAYKSNYLYLTKRNKIEAACSIPAWKLK